MTGQGIVHHGPVAADQFTGWSVVSEQSGDIGMGFLAHRVPEKAAEVVTRLPSSVIHQGNRLLHFQPLRDEGAEKEVIAFRVTQQTVRLSLEDFPIPQFTGCRQFQQFRVGRRTDQHETQAGGHCVVGNGLVLMSGGIQVAERAAHEHGLEGGAEGVVESHAVATKLLVKGEKGFPLRCLDRPPVGPLHPEGEQLLGAFGVIADFTQVDLPFGWRPSSHVIEVQLNLLEGDERSGLLLRGPEFLFVPGRPEQPGAIGQVIGL